MAGFHGASFSSVIRFLAHLQYIFSRWLQLAQIHVFFIGGVGVALVVVHVIFLGIRATG